MVDKQDSALCEFYENRSVFITGATGFVGKVLLEKLLRSCRGIKHVYILMREKKGKSPKQRVEQLMTSQGFDLLKAECPEVVKKVLPITGDISLPYLGISESDICSLAGNVSIVFHVAASVRFDEPLKQAVDTNVMGTKRMLELCHKLPKIEAVVHVSTAYSNCNKNVIDEVVCPPPMTLQQVTELIKWMDPKLLETITPKIVGDRPNTYIFAKAIAETVFVEECGNIPAAIVRPSVVTFSWKEPFPGWIDTYSGPSGIFVAYGKGILRTFLVHEEAVVDFIPVDVVANLLIAVAWYIASHRPQEIMVYNCGSGSTNGITWRKVLEIGSAHVLKYPSAKIFRYPNVNCQRNLLWNDVCVVFQHYLPASLVDIMSYIFYQKTGMVKLYQKLDKAAKITRYFSTHEWMIHCKNVMMLNDLLSEEDKKNFCFDIRHLDWNRYFENGVLGCRKFLLNEDPSTIPAARKYLRRHYIISQLVKILLAAVVWKVFFSEVLSLNKLSYLVSAATAKVNDAIQSL